MIDLSQWRARIGQWNYRGPKSHGGHHCPLFKGNGKPYGSTSEGKAAKLLKTFSVVAFILTFILRQMQLALIGMLTSHITEFCYWLMSDVHNKALIHPCKWQKTILPSEKGLWLKLQCTSHTILSSTVPTLTIAPGEALPQEIFVQMV